MSDAFLLGHSVAVSLVGCDAAVIEDPSQLEAILRRGCKDAGYEVVAGLSHAFDPTGVTCSLILAQSHLVAHSWPEYELLTVDLFACAPPESLDMAIESIRAQIGKATVIQEVRSHRISIASEGAT